MNKKLPHKTAAQKPSPPPDPAAAIPPDVQALLEKAPRQSQKTFRLWLAAITALDAAPNLQKRATARVWARRLSVRPSTVYNKRFQFRKDGPIALLDKRFSGDLWKGNRSGLPGLAIAHLKQLSDAGQLPAKDAIRALFAQLERWRAGDASARIPGYGLPPAGNPPKGWTSRNLARFLAPRARRPAPGHAVFKVELALRKQGDALVLFARQTLPKSSAKAAPLARSGGKLKVVLC